ncbi:SPOSA6832_01338 [Sporobolomyces salmonicolor]|uniref:SPOSA6832_01338-mRNA-1:cds n=1 Tax=Sporidiobolus salmonicolor TaxID=5005 RepID=A0A0D6EIK9_SPOSA|nr:SPOSA6832_01338 [Sporobolomyces salmonicolor]
MSAASSESLSEAISRLLPNGLGARGDEERDPLVFPHRNLHVLLACSGSVASIKAPLIVRELLKARPQLTALGNPRYEQVDVQVVATKSALHFFDAQLIEAEHGGRVKVWTDAEEWAAHGPTSSLLPPAPPTRSPSSPTGSATVSSSVFSPIFIVSVSKRTSLLRALPSFVPVHLFPAMNTHMFSHPLTAKQLAFVKAELGYTVHGPIAKTLACGDVGMGAMTEWSAIVQLVVNECKLQRCTGDS